ncbi:MAG TPA: heme o synthase [Thermoanaerobaculia bacterium]
MTTIALTAEPRRATARDYFELSKGRIVMMVLITTAAGFLFAAQNSGALLMAHSIPAVALLFMHTLIGTALVAAGTNALNQYVEREHDAKMLRTRTRPLPSGRMSPRAALLFSSLIAIAGTLYLGLLVNWLTAFLGAFTLTSYIFVYTPLKRISTICTVIGAIPGAIPPLMGWTAVTDSLDAGGLAAFGILFFWQLAHFMAISWLYRHDYDLGGYVMLAVRDESGTAVARHAIFYSLALLAVSVAPFFLGLSGVVYLAGAVVGGAAMIALSVRFFFERNARNARTLFMTSNIYLLAVMILLVVA